MAFDKLGIAPPNPSTDVGKFRLLAGDSEYQALVPPVPGMGHYQTWSDMEIAAFIEISGGSVPRAIALAYTQIGASFAASGATIKTDDLSYSSKDSVGSWQSLARYWTEVADKADQKAADDMFIMVETRADDYWMRPEGSPRRYDEFPFWRAFDNSSTSGRGDLDGGTP